MSEKLFALLDLINTQVREIHAIASSKNASIPDLDESDVDPGLIADPAFKHAADLAIAAAKRLIATLSNPNTAAISVATGGFGAVSLNVAIETNVTEALREAGPQGLHVRDLAPKLNMDPNKLGHFLRYLSVVHHTYREISPNVFVNNRLSAVLDTGKPFDEVKDRHPSRHTSVAGPVALVAHVVDNCLVPAASLTDYVLDPKTAFSNDPIATAGLHSLGYDGTWWDFIEQKGQEKRLTRYNEAMKIMDKMFPKEAIINDFEWGKIPQGGVVVDVGGGLGGATLPLARTFPGLRFIIQDRPQVIADGKKFWGNEFPEALSSKLVELQGHNLFEPQSVQGADVYFLRLVLHNWPDVEATKILKQLRSATEPKTKVVILDLIVPYGCPVEDETLTGNVPGALGGIVAPGNGIHYMLDLLTMVNYNAQERTLMEWESLAKATGFEVESVKTGSICAITLAPV